MFDRVLATIVIVGISICLLSLLIPKRMDRLSCSEGQKMISASQGFKCIQDPQTISGGNKFFE